MKNFSKAGFVLTEILSPDKLDNKELLFYFNSLFSNVSEKMNAIVNSDIKRNVKINILRDLLVFELEHISDIVEDVETFVNFQMTDKDISDYYSVRSYLESVLDTKFKRSIEAL